MFSGMITQQLDLLRLAARCAERGVTTVVGGPDVSSNPEIYAAIDIRVIGEAEGIIEDFLAAWRAGTRQGEFRAPLHTVDVTTSPTPRFDLLDFSAYLNVNVQLSRGCPFLCEFCDIIELFGRKPRAKTSQQVLAELDRLHALGYRGHVDFVDDNLIGNKKAVKAFLPKLVEWQKARGYPFEFSTEASLNLADDAEFLGMMRDAGFFATFVGIESPDPEVLVAMKKKQNTKRDIAHSVHTIQSYGIFVIAGFIIGFDNESEHASAGHDRADRGSLHPRRHGRPAHRPAQHPAPAAAGEGGAARPPVLHRGKRRGRGPVRLGPQLRHPAPAGRHP